MYQGQGSPRKNLWKSINHQRVKYSVIDPTSTVPVLSNSKQSNHNSQPLRNLNQKMKHSNGFDQNFLQSKFQSASREVEYDMEQQDNEYGKQSSTKFYLNTKPVLHENIDNKQKNTKNRKFSIGEQSIIQQIVDLKNGNNLDICEFQQDQQPMIMSLGSQSNPAIRHLKLSKMKDEIQKLQVFRKQFLRQVKEQKQKYQQFFQDNFHKTINYLIEHYYNKIEQSQQEQDRVDSNPNYFVSPSSLKTHLFHDEDTPRFPKRIVDSKSKSNSKFQQSEAIEQKVEEIQMLEQQLFKIKLQYQDLLEKIQRLEKENKKIEQENQRYQLQIQMYQESQFDFDQKVAQLQIQVKEKVDKMVEQKIIQAKLSEEKKLQKKYIAQMNEKQNVIKELDSIVEQVAKRQQKMRQKQKQFKEKQKNLNEQFIQFNSQKLDFQIKLEKFQIKQAEFKSLQAALEEKQAELALREKQLNNKLNENSRVNESILKGSVLHKKTQSGQQKYYGDELQQDETDYKIYNIKNRSNLHEQKYGYRDSQKNYSSLMQSPNPNINLNLNLNNIGRFKQTQIKNSTYQVLQLGKNWKFNHLQRQNEHESIKSLKGSASKERNKNNSITKPILVSPTHHYSMNRSFAVNPKTNISSNNSTFTQGKTYVHNRVHTSSLFNNKSQDKNRLEDLGSKLQNLRNQIRKQIHDMD